MLTILRMVSRLSKMILSRKAKDNLDTAQLNQTQAYVTLNESLYFIFQKTAYFVIIVNVIAS